MILAGGGEILETEKGHINNKEAKEGYRLELPSGGQARYEAGSSAGSL